MIATAPPSWVRNVLWRGFRYLPWDSLYPAMKEYPLAHLKVYKESKRKKIMSQRLIVFRSLEVHWSRKEPTLWNIVSFVAIWSLSYCTPAAAAEQYSWYGAGQKNGAMRCYRKNPNGTFTHVWLCFDKTLFVKAELDLAQGPYLLFSDLKTKIDHENRSHSWNIDSDITKYVIWIHKHRGICIRSYNDHS